MAAEKTKTEKPKEKPAPPPRRVERVFLGTRTAEELAADLIRAHTA